MVGIILQARMGSSRLPGKILMDLAGKPLLGRILERLGRLETAVPIVIATSMLPQDDVVEKFCRESDVLCFRGDEANVLKRYCDCAEAYRFSQVVRMTGDNPFPDIEELDRLIAYHLEHQMEFSENFSVLPVGVGMEAMCYPALKESLHGANLPKHFEHADEYILDHLAQYRHGTLAVKAGKHHPDVRLTVDTQEDFERALFILQESGSGYVTTEQAIILARAFETAGHQQEN